MHKRWIFYGCLLCSLKSLRNWLITCVSKDNVHILVSARSDISPAEIMRLIKGKTSAKIFEEFPHIKKRFWGRHFWARGYFCVTAGEMTKEMILDYLAHHFEKSPDDRFDVES